MLFGKKKKQPPFVTAIIPAAGSSRRMGGGNKLLMELDGVPVLGRTLLALEACDIIREIVVAASEETLVTYAELGKTLGITKLTKVVKGGATRQESARRGMSKLDEHVRYVAIADGARCLTTPAQIDRVCLAAYRTQAASAAHQITDTVKRTNAMGMTKENVDRNNLWLAQTPQVFHTSLYTAALYHAQNDNFTATDDNSLIEHLGYRVRMVECGLQNIKITTASDLPVAEAILQYRGKNK